MATTDGKDNEIVARSRAQSRRRFVRKAAYLAPLVLTFPTTLRAAQTGSAVSCPPGQTPPTCDS